ncbi:MAG TPA: hypothetical protein VFV75_01605 [Candidatus Polarisedimenticolaceae bacterium]|nr:hypothetical protein [Candidatus Polarisedimenticolaceae bacterium]
MKTCTRLLLLLLLPLLAYPATAAVPVDIDLLPGESENVVDREAGETVTVVLFGSREVDARTILLDSLRLAGAAAVKDASGRTHVLEDVNGDGATDLVVQFASLQMQIAEGSAQALLEGRTSDGTSFAGRDVVRTVSAALRAADPSTLSASDEKLPPLAVALEIAGEGGVVVPGTLELDPRDIRLDSVRLNGHVVGKGEGGILFAYEDLDGDGREDLRVTAPPRALTADRLDLSATTRTGRILRGTVPLASAQVRPPGGIAFEPAPPPPGVVAQGDYPYVIQIPDVGVASAYPATVHVSGVSGVVSKVRVTLDGIIHSCFNDLDVLLVAPGGQSVVLMSDVGSCFTQPNATYLTFDDNATTVMDRATLPYYRSTVRPSNFGLEDSFPAPASPPSSAASLSVFHGIDPNGDWKLYVVDDAAGDSGVIAGGWSLDLVTSTRVCNPTALAIADQVSSTSSVALSGLPRSLLKAAVTLTGLTHARSADLDLMLVDPQGRRVTLMSDMGGTQSLGDMQFTFDDDAFAHLDDFSPFRSGTYQCSDAEPGESPPAPAPQGGPTHLLRTLRGNDPNGTWQLFLGDDTAGATGVLAGGWCLEVTTFVPMDWCSPYALTVPAGAPEATSGAAAPYPDTMGFIGTSGLVRSAEVKLLGVSHTYPDDLDVVLQSPSGGRYTLMSDAGGSIDIANLDVTFSTEAASSVPDELPPGSGPYAFTDYEPGDTLPAPAPPPPSSLWGSQESPNGTWSLWIADDAALDWGTITGGWCLSLGLYEPSIYSFCQGGSDSLTIPAGAPGISAGPASPYPWSFYVPQEGTILRNLRVRLQSLSHTHPDDLDVLLVGPQGQAAVIMSDAGGSTDVTQVTLTFDSAAAGPVPDDGVLGNATYWPANYGDQNDPYPSPAPPGPHDANPGVFVGTDPHGIWSLYVVDDAAIDVGSATQWCIDFFPVYPPGEATGLAWKPSDTILGWDVAPNATEYTVLRGAPADLPNLLTGVADSCVADHVWTQEAASLTSQPPPGSFFWYLVQGRNAGGARGPTGTARIAGVPTARSAEEIGACAP